jgi:CDGSH-type Zn-finger protein
MGAIDVLEPELALAQLENKQPEHEWIGELQGRRGICRKTRIEVRAMLSFTGGVLIGCGASANFPYDDPGAHISIDGSAGAAGVSFDLVIERGVFAAKSFICDGVINAAEDEISGGFAIGCLYPESCGCKGGGGSFRLTKVAI